MITCITPTGDRPEAFKLTRKWIFSQTRKPDQWIVIDDGKKSMSKELQSDLEYVRREPKDGEGHTLVLNMKEAVKHIKGDMILIIEDDDWYGPKYIETMESKLQIYDLVGEMLARYYHLVAMKYRRIGNTQHASFCQTGFTKRLLPTFISCLDGDPYIDARLWAAVKENKFLINDGNDELKLHCSLKGLRGRKGIGSGHNVDAGYYNVDVGLFYLVKWIGEENARLYMKHVGQSFESAKLIGIDKKGHKPTTTPIVTVEKERPVDEKITVITCTGDRPEVFELCKRWMANQTQKPDQWIVVDDGKIPLKVTKEFEYQRRVPSETDYQHTLCLNLLRALPNIRHNKIILMEDDDWYHPTYIDYMDNLLKQADLVGLGNLVFYCPKISSYMEKKTIKQPALAQTAFNGNVLPVIKEICEKATSDADLCGKGLVDVHLWKNPLNLIQKIQKIKLLTDFKIASGKILPAGTIFEPPLPNGLVRKAERKLGAELVNYKIPYMGKKLIVQCDKYISVGMKGMPGRKGYTTHHNLENKKYKKDSNKELLTSILKKDIEYYLGFFS